MCVCTRESGRKRKSGVLVGSSFRPSDWVGFLQSEVILFAPFLCRMCGV